MAHSHSMKANPGQLVGLATLSAAIGAGMALLFAPKKGEETRSQLKQRADTMRHKMVESKNKTSDQLSETADQAKTTAQNATTRARSTTQKVKEDAKDTAEETKRNTRSTRRNSNSNPDDRADEIRRNGEP